MPTTFGHGFQRPLIGFSAATPQPNKQLSVVSRVANTGMVRNALQTGGNEPSQMG
jgi:hypothetical protein